MDQLCILARAVWAAASLENTRARLGPAKGAASCTSHVREQTRQQDAVILVPPLHLAPNTWWLRMPFMACQGDGRFLWKLTLPASLGKEFQRLITHWVKQCFCLS